MIEHDDVPRVALQRMRECLIATIQVELSEEVLSRFREDLLSHIRCNSCRGAVLEVSGLEVMDSQAFSALAQIASMASLMGARTIMTGLRPGVAASLMDLELDLELSSIQAAPGLEEAIDWLTAGPAEPEAEREGAEEAAGQEFDERGDLDSDPV